MTNHEQLDSIRPANASTGGNPLQNDAAAFCRIMERLNAVSLRQTEGLLNIAVSAAEKSHALSSPSIPTESGGGGGSSEFIDRMKEGVEKINQDGQEALREVSSSIEDEKLREAIEHALANAVRNSVNCQQQLNEIGTAILTQSAALLLKG